MWPPSGLFPVLAEGGDSRGALRSPGCHQIPCGWEESCRLQVGVSAQGNHSLAAWGVPPFLGPAGHSLSRMLLEICAPPLTQLCKLRCWTSNLPLSQSFLL